MTAITIDGAFYEALKQAQAKADAMPRFEPYEFDEEEREHVTCEDCKKWLKLTDFEARTILGQINPYAHVYDEPRKAKAVREACKRCGICKKHLEITACTDEACDDFKERR